MSSIMDFKPGIKEHSMSLGIVYRCHSGNARRNKIAKIAFIVDCIVSPRTGAVDFISQFRSNLYQTGYSVRESHRMSRKGALKHPIY